MKNLQIYFMLAVIITTIISCKKAPTLPTVTTTEVSAITINSVTSGGTIIDDGGAPILDCGIYCSCIDSINPEKNGIRTNDLLVKNSFVSHVNGLEPSKTYYLRAYATNEVGTGYGEIISFTTSNTTTSVTTLDATNIQFSYATLNGDVTTNDDQNVISFIYGKSENNLDQSINVSTFSKSASTYYVNATISNLENNTTYYFAIKTVNSGGTFIGETKNFKTLEGSLVDYDGNNYKIVKIGNQVWSAENLKTTHYNDGSAIPNVTDENDWTNLISGAYCNYDNNPQNSVIYGCLYNAYAIWTDKLAPAGWHVANYNDWLTLINFVNQDGGSLKGLEYWKSPNIGATNSYGFNALPNGGRLASNSDPTMRYKHLTESASWWQFNREYQNNNACNMVFINFNDALIINTWVQYAHDGYGVRLVKN